MLMEALKNTNFPEKKRYFMDSLERFNPLSLLKESKAQIEHSLNDSAITEQTIQNIWFLHIDLIETYDNITLMADVPGMDFEDIKITIENEIIVTILGERKIDRDNGAKSYSLTERFSGGFYRRFLLPTYVNSKEIQIKVARGVLSIHLPKKFKDA